MTAPWVLDDWWETAHRALTFSVNNVDTTTLGRLAGRA